MRNSWRVFAVIWTLALVSVGVRAEDSRNTGLDPAGMVPAAKPAPDRIFSLDKTAWGLFAGDVAVRSLDAYSTQRALRNPANHEQNVPGVIVSHPAAEWAYSLSIPVAYLMVAQTLVKHRHPRMAKLVLMADIGYDVYPAVHNCTLPVGQGSSGLVRFGGVRK